MGFNFFIIGLNFFLIAYKYVMYLKKLLQNKGALQTRPGKIGLVSINLTQTWGKWPDLTHF